MGLKFSERVMHKFGLPQITQEDKELILGRNFARMVGLDVDDALARVVDDEFSQRQREQGLAEPFSYWRKVTGS